VKKMNMAQAFDEWMRRYEEDPKAFETEFQAVDAHRADPLAYGKQMAVYLRKLMREPPRRSKPTAKQKAASRRNAARHQRVLRKIAARRRRGLKK
jgi:hypothetical protein